MKSALPSLSLIRIRSREAWTKSGESIQKQSGKMESMADRLSQSMYETLQLAAAGFVPDFVRLNEPHAFCQLYDFTTELAYF